MEKNIYEIIKNIEQRKWNEAKAIWTMKVQKIQPRMIGPRSFNIITWGTENEMFISCFLPFQEYTLKRKCTSSCERNNTQKINQYLYFQSDINRNIVLFNDRTCRLCDKSRSYEIIFNRHPLILIIETALHFSINIQDIPKQLIINNKKYCFLMMTTYLENRAHFVSLFEINNHIHFEDDKPGYILHNDLTPLSQITDYSKLQPSNCVYFLSN